MRRLNRTEYRNTIRDLIGIDFDPTQDFPSDDIGHGFDNIGDVLTLSPVLMERYMAAAEGILHRAIVPDPPKPTKRHLGAEHTEPASGNAVKKLMEGKFRRLASDAEASIETGPIHTSYQWVADGEYQFRSRMYAKTDGSEPVKVAILIEGKGLTESSTKEELSRLVGKVREPSKIVAIAEVAGRSPENADKIEVTLPPMAGRDRVMIALSNRDDDAPPVQLFVEHMALEGPMDMRPASPSTLAGCRRSANDGRAYANGPVAISSKGLPAPSHGGRTKTVREVGVRANGRWSQVGERRANGLPSDLVFSQIPFPRRTR